VKTEHGALEPLTGFDWIKMSCNMAVDRLVSRYLVDRIVYVSKDIQKRNEPHYEGVQGEVIYNGIPPFPARPFSRPPELDASTFNLGIVGRLTAVKGHRYLLQALKDLPLPDLRLHVLGDGELRAELERASQEDGLRGRVFFRGFRPDAEDYLRSLDAVVMPSVHEGFPYTMLEAAYWGVPLIASRVGGMQEVLEDQRDCLLVEPRNVHQLREAILTLYKDSGLGKTLAENARRKVTANFLIDAMVAKYLSVYDRSLGQASQ
jgi:L-malate glycosyltransferase